MKWFSGVFLQSFKDGETRISEKQFDIFCKYLHTVYEMGYTEYHEGIINNKRVRAYVWDCITGPRYYVIIENN